MEFDAVAILKDYETLVMNHLHVPSKVTGRSMVFLRNLIKKVAEKVEQGLIKLEFHPFRQPTIIFGL